MPLRVAGRFGEVGDLAGDDGPLGLGAGGPERVVVSEQAAGESSRVVDRTGDYHRPLGEWSGPRAVLGDGVLKLASQRRRHQRLVGCVRVDQRLTRPVKHGDEVGAGHGEPGAYPVQPEGDRAHAAGVVELERPLPGCVEQFTRCGGVASPQPGVGLRGEQVD